MSADHPVLSWPDIGGRLTAEGHVLPLRIYYEDTDFTGIAYHGAFVRFFERGRSEFLRALAIQNHEIAHNNAPGGFAVRRLNLDFRRPARYEDLLEVVTRPKEVTGASTLIAQTIRRHADREVIVLAEVQLVIISPEGRPLAFSRKLRDGMESQRLACAG